MTTIKSTNVIRKQSAFTPPSTPIDEYALVFAGQDGKPWADACIPLTFHASTKEGSTATYAKALGANAKTGSAVATFPSLPVRMAVAAFSKGEFVRILGKAALVKVGQDTDGRTFHQFEGVLDEALPNGAVRINAVRVRKSETGYSLWAYAGCFVTSWHRGRATSNKTGQEMAGLASVAI